VNDVRRLVDARKAAIERGDKALGREIYHQLLLMGVDPDAINADTVDVDAFETADVAPAPEKAVKRGPGRPRKDA